MAPVLEDDPLLMFMVGQDEVEEEEDTDATVNGGAGEHQVATELSTERARSAMLVDHIGSLKHKITQMETMMKDIIVSKDIYRPVSACRVPQAGAPEDETYEDSGYFQSYDNIEIHREMLQDRTRTEAYRDAMVKNPSVFKDKIVMDIGCGTGILSMFAVRAGAKHVYAVDRSAIANSATANVFENGMADKITVLRTSVEAIKLPVDHVDIIVSEWMGYFLLYESMLDSVLHAADKWLADDGIILPNDCNIMLAAADAEGIYSKHVSYWDDVYGFKMPCMKTSCFTEASLLVVPVKDIITNAATVFSIDINKRTKQEQLDFKSEFSFKATRDGRCSSIVGYFDVGFKLPEQNVVLTTEPVAPGLGKETHWVQTVFFLPKPVLVKEGQELTGHIDCRKNPVDPRALLVDITFNGEKLKYQIS